MEPAEADSLGCCGQLAGCRQTEVSYLMLEMDALHQCFVLLKQLRQQSCERWTLAHESDLVLDRKLAVGFAGGVAGAGQQLALLNKEGWLAQS